jgi:thioredoxin reductase (NADPH)
VDTYALEIQFHERVIGIERAADGVFDVTTVKGGGPQHSDLAVAPETAHSRVRRARAIVIAIGYYDHPNYLGVPGEDLEHVSHYFTDPHPFYRQRVVVVGGRNSAAEAALELFRGGAHVTLVHRHPTLGDTIKYWVRPDIENRIKEGSIAARFQTSVVEIRPGIVVVEKEGAREEIPANAVFLLTGYHPDVDLLRQAGVRCDQQTQAPALDSETLETNVPNLFVAGGATAGRETGTIFIENGRFHGEKIVQVIAERAGRKE